MFTFESTKFLKHLEEKRREWKKPIVFRITVPEELRWWYYQEHGTATHNEFGDRGTYRIEPIRAPYLKWPDPDQTYGPNFDGFHRRDVVLAHPGVKPTRMVAKVLDDIHEYGVSSVIDALRSSGWSWNAVRNAMITSVMPEAKKLIIQSIEQELPGTREDGKLNGNTAAWEFEKHSQIEDLT